LLNALPATRLTATALDAFLQVAGHRLYGAYGRQFVKLLHCVDDEFLGDLRKVGGAVVRVSKQVAGGRVLLALH
jgi:nucleoporin GLE1